MATRKVRWILALGLLAAVPGRSADAQAPTLPLELPQALPGSNSSTLGTLPGTGGGSFLDQAPGGGSILGGRAGTSTPRVPTEITTPGAGFQPPTSAALAISAVAPLTQVPLYGLLELPSAADEGPPDGLTFDQALDLLIRQNLDLLA